MSSFLKIKRSLILLLNLVGARFLPRESFMSWRTYVISLVLVALLVPFPAAAQTTMGTITGLVTDSSQAVIPGATVVAKNMATGAEAHTTTSTTGNYVLISLPVGSYDLVVTQTGFKAFTRSNIVLSSADNLRVDVTLEVGQVTEKVQVTAEGGALKTETTDVSTTLE